MRNEFSPKIKHVKTDIEKRIKAATSETKKKKKKKERTYSIPSPIKVIAFHTRAF